MTYTVASFFTGAMGLDLGFIEEGADIVLTQELDPHAVTTIRANGHDVIPGDLNDVRDSIISSCPSDLFAVIGGPPCQSFSMAGKRRGTGDPRGELVGTYLDTAVAMNPPIHRHGKRGGDAVDEIRRNSGHRPRTWNSELGGVHLHSRRAQRRGLRCITVPRKGRRHRFPRR